MISVLAAHITGFSGKAFQSMLRRFTLGSIVAGFLFILCLNSRLVAQPAHAPAQADSLFGNSPGAFLALSVANIDTMVAWYRDTLGFTVYSTGAVPERGVRFALLKYGNALLEILQMADARPRSLAAPETKESYQIHGFFKSGFVVNDIDAAYRRVQKLRLKVEYALTRPPNGPYRSFGVRDPESNLLQFFGQ